MLSTARPFIARTGAGLLLAAAACVPATLAVPAMGLGLPMLPDVCESPQAEVTDATVGVGEQISLSACGLGADESVSIAVEGPSSETIAASTDSYGELNTTLTLPEPGEYRLIIDSPAGQASVQVTVSDDAEPEPEPSEEPEPTPEPEPEPEPEPSEDPEPTPSEEPAPTPTKDTEPTQDPSPSEEPPNETEQPSSPSGPAEQGDPTEDHSEDDAEEPSTSQEESAREVILTAPTLDLGTDPGASPSDGGAEDRSSTEGAGEDGELAETGVDLSLGYLGLSFAAAGTTLVIWSGRRALRD